jgi:ribonuclease P protein component
MLPKKERLNRTEFNRFFSLGTRLHSPSLMLIYHTDDAFHASAVASKKIWKSAVLRNKFRRRVYDAMRQFHKEKPLKGAYILIAKTGAQTASYDALKTEIHDLIHKTGRIG